MTEQVTRQKIRTWMNRQRTLGTPSPAYYEWLRKQFVLRCEATVTRGKKNENTDNNL
jgi:hypothetical protein